MSRVFVLVALGFFSCGGTAQTRRSFPVIVSAVPGVLRTDSGWTVTLSSARASLSTLRCFSGEALARRPFDPLGWLVSSAWAHPGHYVAGAALCEVLTPVDVDLLAPETTWADAAAVTGTYGSVQVAFGDTGLRLAGTATRGADVVAFDTGDVVPPAAVEGIPFAHLVDTSVGRLRLAVDLDALLSRVDFTEVGAGASPLDPSSPAFNGVARGVRDSSAYVVTWESQP